LDDERPRALIVELSGRVFGLPVAQVREVLRPRDLVPIPGAPPAALGLINVRGVVVTVLDLAALLSASLSDDAPPTHIRAVGPQSIVLLEHGGRAVGVAVDAVHDVRPLDEASAVTDELSPLARDTPGPTDRPIVRLDVSTLLARVMPISEEGP